MSAYTTFFPSSIKVGGAIDKGGNLQYDNLQTQGIGDVVLSQNLVLSNAINTAATAPYIVLPTGTDLLGIDLTVTNTNLPSVSGTIIIIPTQIDGTQPGAGTTVILSAALYSNPVPLGVNLANIYLIPVPYRLYFQTSVAIAGATIPQIVAEVRYSIRG